MQNVQDIQEKIFFEIRNVLDNLSKIDSKEELLSKQDLFAEVADRMAFLRILEKNKESFRNDIFEENVEKQEIYEQNTLVSDEELWQESPLEDDVIEEEVMFTNEINEIDNENESAEKEFSEVIEQETEIFQKLEENIEEVVISVNQVQELPNYKDRVAEKEREFLELEERRRKIVDFSKEDAHHEPVEQLFHAEEKAPQHVEKKFKLAHIKGLKAVQNFFDEDPLEKITETESHEIPADKPVGSLIKSNIPTDFMEASKKRAEFKIDFNDKVAFSKMLFAGNEEELRATVAHLNTFEKLEDAKQFLSELYYKKDWSKVDEYAQRLWELVENKLQ